MADNPHYEAVKLLARAIHERLMGRSESAEELLDQIFALAGEDKRLVDYYPYFAAHVEMYRLCRDTGRVEEASEYFNKAIKLGADAEELRTEGCAVKR